jgi:hypothetical protein
MKSLVSLFRLLFGGRNVAVLEGPGRVVERGLRVVSPGTRRKANDHRKKQRDSKNRRPLSKRGSYEISKKDVVSRIQRGVARVYLPPPPFTSTPPPDVEPLVAHPISVRIIVRL